jgi:hypothetical protein
VIYWKSDKQNNVSRSTTEASLYALLDGITEVKFFQDNFASAILCNSSCSGEADSSIESLA